MKKTAIQQAIAMVRTRMESQSDTLMGKHTAHHLQQVERDLYDLLREEKDQIENAFDIGSCEGFDYGLKNFNPTYENGEQYYKETYK